MDDYLSKPIRRKELTDTLQRVVKDARVPKGPATAVG
jgi:YesN/AraC family two-component response regulator